MDRLARGEIGLHVRVEGQAGNADEDQYYPEMDDIAAVATRVHECEIDERARVASASMRLSHPRPFVKLQHDCRGYEGGERKGHERRRMSHAECEEADERRDTDKARPGEIFSEALER